MNWLTTSIAPPTSARARFIFPCASSKIRRPAIFSAICRASASVSSIGHAQQHEHPGADLSADLAGHGDLARRTRWTQARMDIDPLAHATSRRQWRSRSCKRKLTSQALSCSPASGLRMPDTIASMKAKMPLIAVT